MRHATSKHVYAYWRQLRGKQAVPSRSDFDPTVLGRHLTDVFLLEGDETGHFSFRVAGSNLCALFGEELRGKPFLAMATHATADDLGDMLSAVIEDGVAVIAGASAILSDRMSLEAELLLLPLLHNGALNVRVLGSLTFPMPDRLALGDCAGLEILSFRTLSDGETRFLLPSGKTLLMDYGSGERRGHLTVLTGGQK